MSYRQAKRRKIKRSKSLYGNRRKEKRNHVVALVVTLFAAAGLVFFGYSIGKPILDYINNDEYNKATEGTAWAPPAETTLPEETTSVTTPAKNTATLSKFGAYELESYNLTSLEALEMAVTKAKSEGYTAICVPLKERGGHIYYDTKAEIAVNGEDIILSTISAKTIATKIQEHDMLAIAKVSALYDNVAPFSEKEAGYLFEGQISSWYDNSVDQGGKPWLSPFSEHTKTYMTQLVGEVDTAGFDAIICADVVFPTLRNSDIEYIGEIVRSPERYKALLDIVAIFETAETDLMLEVSAAKILTGTEEVFKLGEISEETQIVVEMNYADLIGTVVINGEEANLSGMSVYDRTTTVLGEISRRCGDRKIIPHINTTGISEVQLEEARRAIREMKFDSTVYDGAYMTPAATTAPEETPAETTADTTVTP